MDLTTAIPLSSPASDPHDWEALADLGEAVTCSTKQIFLDEPNSLWLVTGGVFDLFAVETGRPSRWTPVGRLLPGTVLIAPVAGPRHTLLVTPSADAGLVKLSLGELARRSRAEARSGGGTQGLLPWQRAVADGLDIGFTVLMRFILADLPPKDFVPLVGGRDLALTSGQSARPAAGVVWVDVLEGELKVAGPTDPFDRYAGDWATLTQYDWIACRTNAVVRTRSTRELTASGVLWARATRVQNHVLYMADRAVERRERHVEARMSAGRAATRAVTERAHRSLGNVLNVKEQGDSTWRSFTDLDPTTAACRAVTEAMGIEYFPLDGPPAHTQAGPIERVAVRARLRTRTISLTGAWWRANVGPFVGHRTQDFGPAAFIWERGRYRAWDPVTGETTKLDEHTAAQYESRAVMFYKPLPEHPVSTWALIRSGFVGAGGDIRAVALGTFLAVALGSLVPMSTGTVLGALVPAARTDLIVQVCCALLLAGIASAAFGVMENMALLRLEGRFEATVQAAVWDRLLRLPAGFFKDYSTGELAGAALGIADIRTLLMGVSSTVLYSSTVAGVSTLILFWTNVTFALIAVALAAGALGVFAILGFKQIKWQVQSLQLRHELTNKVFQKLRGLPKLRVAAAEERAYADWVGTFSEQKEIQKRIGRYEGAIAVVNAAYTPFCLLLVFLIESSSVGGRIPVPDFLTLLATLTVMLSAIVQVTSKVTSAISVVPILKRLDAILRHPLEVSNTSNVPGELSGNIEVNHLTFGYDKDARPVLDDVSFRVRPGEFLAVVGASGGGKSTLLRMLLGFEKPDAGTVLYDGQDLSSMDSAAVRRQCGVVLQQTKPFAGTILQAITGSMNYSLAEAWEAAELAGLSEDISAMPMGMHTHITDGSTLSGGQRQRLSIAQALIRRPRILYFDEATSALDNRTQGIVAEATQQLKATRVVIAHRLSTVMQADKILVLSQGRVAQYGPPADLLADHGGLFHQLVRRQMS
ncbi:NHLP bacteriocin export ABC transporter permease/ATPase subunit [Streptomyces sp. NPDC086010]|uniref:NHLP bacteriocin export ABC transporter permease/ATPase subunit n=1 Tax=Streptomyces sp. NPDC086010 TaxID=3365745 RepID=UPI0037D152BD